jgi:hypothetical protein
LKVWTTGEARERIGVWYTDANSKHRSDVMHCSLLYK